MRKEFKSTVCFLEKTCSLTFELVRLLYRHLRRKTTPAQSYYFDYSVEPCVVQELDKLNETKRHAERKTIQNQE